MVDQTAERSDQGESRLTVFVALAANAGIGLLKLIAGLLSGSGAMLAEAAHSVGDSSTELLLLTALRRSGRPRPSERPLGGCCGIPQRG